MIQIGGIIPKANQSRKIMPLALTYPDIQFVQQVAVQLPWFHIAILLDKVKDLESRLF